MTVVLLGWYDYSQNFSVNIRVETVDVLKITDTLNLNMKCKNIDDISITTSRSGNFNLKTYITTSNESDRIFYFNNNIIRCKIISIKKI